jgi:hypothetical protein
MPVMAVAPVQLSASITLGSEPSIGARYSVLSLMMYRLDPTAAIDLAPVQS